MYQVYLDNTLLNTEPDGLKDFIEELVRNEAIKGLLKVYNTELTFAGDGYAILYNLRKQSGYCNLVSLKILQKCNDTAEFSEEFNGIIFLTDVRFQKNKCLAITTVQDNSYTAKIFNNKNIRFNLSSTKSKNAIDITACPRTDIEFFNPVDGAYLNTCVSFDIYDAFSFLVRCMTDGDVGFESDYLSNLTDEENLALVAGIEVRFANGNNFPFVSFQETFDNINKKIAIAFAVEKYPNGDHYIRIENEDYFYSTKSTFKFDFIKDLEESVYKPSLYSGVKVGSTNAVQYDPCRHSLVGSSFLGFKSSEFYFLTKCNIDSAIDLISTFIIDSNTIEEIYRSGLSGELDCDGNPYGVTNNYDDNTVLVQYTKTTLQATRTNLQEGRTGTPPPYHYNGILNNKSVIERRNLLGALAQYFSVANQDNTFEANATSDTSENFVGDYNKDVGIKNYSGVLGTEQDSGGWPNEVSDPQGLYDDTTSTYTAATDGYHKFNFYAAIRILQPLINNTEGTLDNLDMLYTMKYSINGSEHFIKFGADDIDELSHIFILGFLPNIGDNSIVLIGTPVDVYLSAGDEIQFILKMKPKAYFENGTPADTTLTDYARRVNWAITRTLPTDTFPVVSDFWRSDYVDVAITPDNGGIVSDGTPDDYRASLMKFTYPLSNENIDLIESDQIKLFDANIDGVNNSAGWINKISRNKTTGMADVELITNTRNI